MDVNNRKSFVWPILSLATSLRVSYVLVFIVQAYIYLIFWIFSDFLEYLFQCPLWKRHGGRTQRTLSISVRRRTPQSPPSAWAFLIQREVRFSKQLSNKIFHLCRIMVHVFLGHSSLYTSKHAFDVHFWIGRCEVNRISWTFSGHCGKTMAMLRRWLKEKKFEKVSWFLIADDDTIIKYIWFKWCFREYEIFSSCGNHAVWKMCDSLV